jgi:hypothetical protein
MLGVTTYGTDLISNSIIMSIARTPDAKDTRR